MKLYPIEENGHLETDVASQDLSEIVIATQTLYKRKGFVPPWIGYLAVENARYVGTCAFTSPPYAGEVEIAYYTFPGCENNGIATSMAGELLKIARNQTSKIIIIAHTLPQDGASSAVLRKHGFELTGEIEHPEDGPVWKWILRKLDSAPADGQTRST
ncbi:GNAT family N-acetyltransferase [Acidovorax sp. sic0104]|uniref:GNAT family N-acetyltransferase n=1 Tax=Acidovorax sp. sic0104 TaxID=2854784 RepID=UPI001C46DF8A|nr:GNAT family protein [Acidovorax sp. sic0104]MBV7544647.1 GNAT family N-acetyltransferase [Acidovorax sp. sic0104]